MAEAAIVVDQHRVGRVPDQRVAEAVLGLPVEPRLEPADDGLALDEDGEELVDVAGARVAAEELHHAAAPEGLPEDARRAQRLARRGRERLEPRLHHGDHGLGRSVAAALGLGPDQLLQVERVPAGAIEDALDHGALHLGAEHLAHEGAGGAARQLSQPDLLEAARAPQVGEGAVHSGRPVASTSSGASTSAPRTASRQRTLGASPQCRSSRTSSTGPRAASAAIQVSTARRICSPITSLSCRAARSCTLASSSSEGRPTSSPRNSATRAESPPATCSATRARSFCLPLREGLAVEERDPSAHRARQDRERRAGGELIAAAEDGAQVAPRRALGEQELVDEARFGLHPPGP